MNTTVVDVYPNYQNAEYLELTLVSVAAGDMDFMPKGSQWQKPIGKPFLLLENAGSVYLLEVDIRSVDTVSGRCWLQDKFGWQPVSRSAFSLHVWKAGTVNVLFDYVDGEPVLDSVRVIRPCKKS